MPKDRSEIAKIQEVVENAKESELWKVWKSFSEETRKNYMAASWSLVDEQVAFAVYTVRVIMDCESARTAGALTPRAKKKETRS